MPRPGKTVSAKTYRKEDRVEATRESVVAEMLEAKRITTLYDKEYWLTLSDGTLVHLARNTRLIYPENSRATVATFISLEKRFSLSQKINRNALLFTPMMHL